jgi:hypothetical protein
MKSSIKRLMFLVSMLGLAVLTGCASTVSIDPFRTRIMATTSVSPGADGVTTTPTFVCEIKDGKRLTDEQVKLYTDPKTAHKAVDDGICKTKNGEVVQTMAVHGSPSLGGEMVKGVVGAAAGGVVNFTVQNALQAKQAAICRSGGCQTTSIVNNNNAYGGAGGAGGNSAANASSSASSTVNSGGSGGGGCQTGGCK